MTQGKAKESDLIQRPYGTCTQVRQDKAPRCYNYSTRPPSTMYFPSNPVGL